MFVPIILFLLGTPAAAWLNPPLPKPGAESSWTPRQTSPAEVREEQIDIGWRAQPTAGPRPSTGRMLVPRVDEYTMEPETCGFVFTDGASFTCLTEGETCTQQSGHIGCCAPNEPCSAIKTACIGYQSSSAGSCNSLNDFHTLCCSDAATPACYTWLLSTAGTSAEPAETLTLFECATRSGSGILLDYDPVSSQTRSYASTTGQTTNEAGNDGSSDSSDSDSGSSTNIGAIVGGVVGGVAAVVLVGVAVFFVRRRKGQPAKK
ncbi:hypothetical protein S7711_07850 [Stachybotrys chartarum IBT 7711]|uniref:Uncharacterized protein n=1 Tax=Stachybotrys chartarum (strain CBS 109288 / IBT 7711) TaxID=1280523 RepID=A0A084AXN4_STACB|nr:hypothetical protein S7711_07850 [Stachybotrys chartarum IBT 7711]KFA52475.1 hypothetical protein S40293_05677 [Stachybotrys chartarum IBT 40293]